MTAQLRIFPETATTVLLVVPQQHDERLLRRAGSVAAMLGADLHVYCPVTRVLAPHSDVTPELSAEAVEIRSDRERARKVAGEVQYLLNEHNTDGYVEAGPCQSLTDGILNAADQWKPDLLILPFIRSDSVLPRDDLIRYEAVWSRLGIPVWIVNSDSPGGDNVAGYVTAEKRHGRGDRKDARVCSAAARLASRQGAEAHLLCCPKPPAALAVAKEAFAPPTKSIAEIEVDAMTGEIHDMAGCHGIPQEHIHVHQGTVGSALADLVEPLQLGLVVTSGRSRSLLDRLSRRWPATEFLDQRCDVLVLGEPGAGIDVA
jgi:hypothetical protein